MENPINISEQSHKEVFRKGKLFEVKIDGVNEKYNVRAENYTELEKNVRLKIKIPKTKNIKIMFEDLVICDDEDLDYVKEMDEGNNISLKVKFCQQDKVQECVTSGYSCNEGTPYNIGVMHGRNYGIAVGKANCRTIGFESNVLRTKAYTNIDEMTITAGEQGTVMGVVDGDIQYSPTHVIGKGDGVTAAKIQGEVQQKK